MPSAGMIPFSEIKWCSTDLMDFARFLLNPSSPRLAPLFVFSFTCHQNIFSIHNELPDNSLPRVKSVIKSCISIAVCVYLTVASIGYMSFGNVEWKDNIVLMYPPGPVITIAQFAIGLLVLLSYPLQVHPCRASLDKVIGASNPRKEGSIWEIGMTLGIILSGWVVAVTVNDLSVVLALVGATGSTTICYILPVCDWLVDLCRGFCIGSRREGRKG
jgi:amino acid permease